MTILQDDEMLENTKDHEKHFQFCSDFQKAFDKVSHQRLLLKLKAHGIGEGIINWIVWLTDRKQGVVVDGEVSNWKSVLSGGVPQGSLLGVILGALLFLIYIYQ